MKEKRVPLYFSLRGKYILSYAAILAAVLVLLNTYPLLASQDLLFASKQDAMRSQAAVISSALMELESLSAEQVERVMNMLDIRGLERILVTDPSGLILYDSTADAQETSAGENPIYRYALTQEVVQALRGYDVYHASYRDALFTSGAAAPIVYRGMTIGALYIRAVDATQGALLRSLQQNLRLISLVIAGFTLFVSVFFSRALTQRVSDLLLAIRGVGEGDYEHRVPVSGRDELTQLAGEFNTLTDRLQRTEEVRRRFVADASHELKTPLTSIQLLSDSILQTEVMEPELVRDFVSDIGAEARRLGRITEHLLALTRLDGQKPAQTEPVDLCDVVRESLAMLQPVAHEAGVTVRVDYGAGCIVRAVRDDLYQVCFNLAENVIKYNVPEGSVSIRVRREGTQVVLEVADDGVGIPEEDRPFVFDRFYRVDKARSRAAGGTGLGLSIVRDTVRRHGGEITVRPNAPRGSVFSAVFPLCRPEAEEAAS